MMQKLPGPASSEEGVPGLPLLLLVEQGRIVRVGDRDAPLKKKRSLGLLKLGDENTTRVLEVDGGGRRRR